MEIHVTDSDISDKEDFHKHSFRIELSYGPLKWVIYRRLFDLLKLHASFTLAAFSSRSPPAPAFPSQMAYAIKRLYSSPELLRHALSDRRKAIQQYLRELVRIINVHSAKLCTEFFEISAMSISKETGWKGKEGYLQMKVHGDDTSFFTRKWQTVWAMCRDSYVAIADTNLDVLPKDILLFDSTFAVESDVKTSKNPLHRIRMSFVTEHRQLRFRGADKEDMAEWLKAMKMAINNSPFDKVHRYGSFAPIRESIRAEYFVDGHDYFYRVSSFSFGGRRKYISGDSHQSSI